jgi:hypothetical protein
METVKAPFSNKEVVLKKSPGFLKIRGFELKSEIEIHRGISPTA